ncbi:MAG TPA: TadE/TadG family type IV pilus assembly protein [Bradyrhizobium sp.]|jgi:Flp pilus assembly protein TadG|nr:TadE/TadG family type IV pilus assembly protein [Bradyrhizobium sp.]
MAGQFSPAWNFMMSPPAASTAFVKKAFRRFGRNRRGSAAVEFALIAPVFFALLFAIIETAVMFFASQVLETVTQESARQIMTGQAQAAGYSASQFLNSVVCPQVPALFTCASIGVDVESDPTSFGNITIANPVTSGAYDPTKLNFNMGGSCSVVTVTLYYQWQLFVTGLGYNISNISGNMRLLSATAAFRNEPYTGACTS